MPSATTWRILTPAALAVLLVAPEVRADALDDENPSADEDCTVEDQCPDTGVRCDEDLCQENALCPDSGTWCSTDDECAALEAAGLERRCGNGSSLYCSPAEAPPEDRGPACHRAAEADGLEARCVDASWGTVFCDPAEDQPGCAVETVGGPGARRVALGAFAVAALITMGRAARRRRG